MRGDWAPAAVFITLALCATTMFIVLACGSSAASTPDSSFPGYVTTCDHGNRLYWHPIPGGITGALAVASQDPTCAK